ncbi:dihydrolipoyl dehydrogenase [Thermodesulfobacteriota bacterium]
MSKHVVIIGAGPGGYVAAIRAAQLGAQVTLVERDNVGGTCLNWGCIPSKVLKTTAEMLDRFRRAKEFGIEGNGDLYPNMVRLMARKQKVVLNQAKGIHALLKHHKIRYLQGDGYIERPNSATVRLDKDGAVEVPWDRLILAMGSRPMALPSFPFDGQTIISSNDALSLSEIPESLVIIGGGVVGCEFAFIFASLGSKVTLIEAMPRLLPLPSVDESCSKILQREMKKRKITFMIEKTVVDIIKHAGKASVTIDHSPFAEEGKASPQTLESDKVLVCIGRVPNTEDMGLANLGIQTDEKGWVQTNERLETNAAGVYAIGDLLGPSKIMLAHVASTEGLAAGENAMGGNRLMNYTVVPGAIFTMPEVANVGLTEAQAKADGYNVRADSVLFRTVGKSQVMGEIAGQAKIISNAESGRILGVHLIGPHASDLIAEGTLALKMGATVKDLAETIHAHPTLAEVMLETSLKAMDKSLHG